jgi:hypothetical protein
MRRGGAWLALGVLVGLGAVGCGDDKARAPSPKAPQASEPEPSVEPQVAEEDITALRRRLAETYHVQRCVLTGRVTAEAGRYEAAGWQSQAEFEARWAEQAQASGSWAASVVRAEMQRPCGEQTGSEDAN